MKNLLLLLLVVNLAENIQTAFDVIPEIDFVDNIAGFTPEMYYNVLDPDVESIRDFRDRLAVDHLPNTPNNLNDFNNFVDAYDVFN